MTWLRLGDYQREMEHSPAGVNFVTGGERRDGKVRLKLACLREIAALLDQTGPLSCEVH